MEVPCELRMLHGAGHGVRGFPVEKMNEMVFVFFNRHFKQER
jgi:hypothetical protein